MAISEKTCAILCFLATSDFCLPELAETAIFLSTDMFLLMPHRARWRWMGAVGRPWATVLPSTTCAEGASMSTDDSDSALHFSVFPRGVTQGVTQRLQHPWLMSSRGFLKA